MLIIGQIFARERGVPHFNALAGAIPCQYSHKWYIVNKKLIKRWDSERELFYDDIRQAQQSTIDLGQNYDTNIGHIVY